MNKSKIEWCDMTWNPVTGCLHGCEYCYARRIAARFGGHSSKNTSYKVTPFMQGGKAQYRYELDKPAKKYDANGKLAPAPYPCGFEPTFHRYRLDEPYQKRGQTIFVCSMADMFGEWVPDEWIDEVFAACRLSPQHRYLFLTKNPARYTEIAKAGKLPEDENFWYGSTATTPDMPFWWSGRYNTFVSIEPMMQPFPSAGDIAVKKVGWVIVGAMTGPGSKNHPPKREWIDVLVQDAQTAGVPVFMKDSLVPVVGEESMLRQFPWEV